MRRVASDTQSSPSKADTSTIGKIPHITHLPCRLTIACRWRGSRYPSPHPNQVRGGEAGVLAELSEEMLAELADGSHGDLGFRYVHGICTLFAWYA